MNALWAIARFTDRIQQLSDYDRGVTVNVGKIAGGQGKNTVPDEAEAVIDIRFCTRADADALVAAIHRAADEAAACVPGSRITIEGGVARLPLERTEASGELMRAYAACARASGLSGDEAPLIGGGSDASTSSAMGSRRSTGSVRAAPGSTPRKSGSRWPRSSPKRRPSRASSHHAQREADL